ncbi:MAG: hypothetical protein RR444_01695 [Oscillospiraceae bacterium]
MPMWLHLVLAGMITLYFLFRYIKDKQIYELLFVIWVPSTLLQYVTTNPTFIRCLGIFQMIMFILVIYFMFKKRGYRRHKTAEILAKYSTGDLDDAVVASDENLHTQAPQEEEKKEDSL